MKKSTSIQTIQDQLRLVIAGQSARVQKRHRTQEGKKEIAQAFEWVSAFSEQYLSSRLQRSVDLQSDEIAKAQKLARAYIGEGNHDFFATCVDGRNMPTVMFSKPPHVGGVLRAPAGAVTGFMEGQSGDVVYIDHESYVVMQISRLLEERSGETIFYGLDSHLGCAARGLIHSTEGGKQQDAGLRSDVKSKLMTARGLLQLRTSLVSSGKATADIIPVFFSFDPHSGGVVAGLELWIDDPRVRIEGYSESVLDALAQEAKILRTIDLLQDPEVLKELSEVIRPGSSDFRKAFAQSMLTNWKAVTKLYDSGTGRTFAKILDRLTALYGMSEWTVGDSDDVQTKKISKKTLRQKAKFLLKNLLTRYSIAGASHSWPYGHHKEEMAVITDGGYAPFEEINAFAVFSRDLNALVPNTKLTIDLIRGFRRSEGISDPVTGSPLSHDGFVAAPVLISNKAVFRQAGSDVWEVLSRLDMTGVLSGIDWDDTRVYTWGKSEIAGLLQRAGHGELKLPIEDVLGLVDALFELFQRLQIMMQDKYFRHMILTGSIVVLSTIVDADRSPRMVVPFVI